MSTGPSTLIDATAITRKDKIKQRRVVDDEASADVTAICQAVAKAPANSLTVESLRAEGLTIALLDLAQKHLNREANLLEPLFAPSDPKASKQSAIDAFKSDPEKSFRRLVLRRKALVLRLCKKALEQDLSELRFLKIGTGDGGERCLQITYRADTNIRNDEPVLYLDGHAKPVELAAIFGRDFVLTKTMIDMPHALVTQICDRHVFQDHGGK